MQSNLPIALQLDRQARQPAGDHAAREHSIVIVTCDSSSALRRKSKPATPADKQAGNTAAPPEIKCLLTAQAPAEHEAPTREIGSGPARIALVPHAE
jgi:hypothetical protein